MNLDYDAARFWWEVVMTAGLLLNFAYQYITAKSKASKEAIDHVALTVIDIDKRLTTVESEVEHLPNHEDLGEIHEKVNTIANSMGKIEGELTALNRNFRLLFEDRLNQGNRR